MGVVPSDRMSQEAIHRALTYTSEQPPPNAIFVWQGFAVFNGKRLSVVYLPLVGTVAPPRGGGQESPMRAPFLRGC